MDSLTPQLGVCDLVLVGRESGRVLLDHISLNLSPGQHVGTIGPSGAGKTLLARSLIGLLPFGVVLKEGRVHSSSGEDSDGESSSGRRLASMVPQTPLNALSPTIPALRLVADVLQWSHGYDKDAAQSHAMDLLREVRIDAQSYHKRPHQLSGGMAMRVAIAAALATRPWFLVLDEPSSGLDPIVRRELADLLLNVADQAGTTLVVVTHDLWMVSYLCKRVVVVEHGRIVADGDLGELSATRIGRIAHEQARGVRTPLAQASTPSLPQHDAAPVLRLRGVSVEYRVAGSLRRRVRALSDVSLTLRAGESVGVIGPSGAGKSTLALVAAGLLRPTHGTVTRSTHGALSESARRSSHAATRMVFQNPFATVNPRHTIGRWLSRILTQGRCSRKRRRSVAELLDVVGLPEAVRDARPAQLSGGQCQRAVIAACLASDVDLLVMDEPVSMLDPVARDEVIGVLSELRRIQCWSYLLVSHDISPVTRLCDHLIVLSEGGVVEHGPLDKVLASPRHELTWQLLEAYGAEGLRCDGDRSVHGSTSQRHDPMNDS